MMERAECQLKHTIIIMTSNLGSKLFQEYRDKMKKEIKSSRTS
jgi:ATP-dependent Clp protease ATP-binding subunit ClpA